MSPDLGAPVAGGTIGAPTTRADWLTWRRGGIGASDIAAITNASPWGSRWSVWVDKVGLAPLDDDDPSDVMQLGLDLEPVIVAWFERRHRGLHVMARQYRATHPDHDWALATLDGLIVEEGSDDVDAAVAVFESKYDAGSRWDEIPEHYRLQVQWQLAVTGLDAAFLAVMHMAFGRPLFEVYEVARDQVLIDRLLAEGERFWMDHIVTGEPPFVDAHPATGRALAEAWRGRVTTECVAFDELDWFLEELRDLRRERDRVERAIVHHENVIKGTLRRCSEGTIAGQTVVSWRSQRAPLLLDARAVRADHGDKYDKRGDDIRVLRLHTPRAIRRTA
jgi:putative phage-type endonuclease